MTTERVEYVSNLLIIILTLAGSVVGIEPVARTAPRSVTSSRLLWTDPAVSGAFCRKQINHVLALIFS